MVAVLSVAEGTGLDQFILNLPAAAIGEGQIVTVSYAMPATNAIRDVDGDAALPFTDRPVTNNSTLDLTPPELASAEVPASGGTLTLTFNEDLGNGAGTLPPASAFTVQANGVVVAVQSVVVGAGTDDFILNLPAGAIKVGQDVTVSYAVPTDGSTIIEDTAGNDALSFTDRAVVNYSTLNVDPPEFVSASVPALGGTLTLTFNEALGNGAGTLPPASAFTVRADGANVAVQSVAVGATTDRLTLNLLRAIGERQIVTVSYAVPATGNVIENVAGGEALPFTDAPVTNNSTVANMSPPELTGAEVAVSGRTLTLTFSEALGNGAGTLPPASTFTVKADGAVVAVESVAVGGSTDELTLTLPAQAIRAGQTVTVSYAAPGTGTVIEDTEGYKTLSFADRAVVNNSGVTPPKLARAEVAEDGRSD